MHNSSSKHVCSLDAEKGSYISPVQGNSAIKKYSVESEEEEVALAYHKYDGIKMKLSPEGHYCVSLSTDSKRKWVHQNDEDVSSQEVACRELTLSEEPLEVTSDGQLYFTSKEESATLKVRSVEDGSDASTGCAG